MSVAEIIITVGFLFFGIVTITALACPVSKKDREDFLK